MFHLRQLTRMNAIELNQDVEHDSIKEYHDKNVIPVLFPIELLMRRAILVSINPFFRYFCKSLGISNVISVGYTV